MTAKDKEVIWDIYERYNQALKDKGLIDFDDYALLCLDRVNSCSSWTSPYTHVIVDKAQDLNKAQILAISKLTINQTPFHKVCKLK